MKKYVFCDGHNFSIIKEVIKKKWIIGIHFDLKKENGP